MPRTRNHKLQPQAINERKSYQTWQDWDSSEEEWDLSVVLRLFYKVGVNKSVAMLNDRRVATKWNQKHYQNHDK